jgi:hypothetical protein
MAWTLGSVARMSVLGVHPVDEFEGVSDATDFSLVLGGPLYQLFRRARLTGDTLELLHRRMVMIVVITWLPLLMLSFVAGPAAPLKIPFLRDIDTQVKLLVALPLLISAELLVHLRSRSVARNFLSRHIIPAADLPRLHEIVRSAKRVRNSAVLEVVMLIGVFTVGQWLWRSLTALSSNSWYAVADGTGWRLTPAGYWYTFVSVPCFQFLLLRWYVRLVIWGWFLWRLSRLNLQILCTHPDRAGGLGFLGKSAYAFAPILFAQGALLAGLIANRVMFEGADLMSFKLEAVTLVAFFVVFVFGPQLVFTPKLALAKQTALSEYGLLSMDYVRAFEEKWVRGSGTTRDDLLGSADVQSLADLASSYDVIREMRFVPFGFTDVTRLVITTVLPLLPLALFVVSLEDLIFRLLKIVI